MAAKKKHTSPAPSAGAGTDEQALTQPWWEAPDDLARLQVIADRWSERGEPRGELVQLSLLPTRTPAQEKRRASLLAKKGAMVGPARPFLREWEFDERGVVVRARCEAERLAEGIDFIGALNPRLMLCVTSLKTQKVMQALAKVSLARLHFVGFTGGIIGSLGGSNLSDKALTTIAPAFRGVRRLALEARGSLPDCFSPQGLATFADSLDGLDFFCLDYFAAADPGKTPLPPVSAYAEVIRNHRAFRSLKALLFEGVDRASFASHPSLRRIVDRDAFDAIPSTPEALAALMA